MTFYPLVDWFDALGELQQKLRTGELPERTRALRDRSQRKLREAWHGAMFGFCYARAFNLHSMSLQVEEEENRDCDITLQWDINMASVRSKIQLKELPPHTLNRGAVTVQDIVDSAARKYPRSHDLTLVVFVNSNGSYDKVRIPKWELGGFWFFGFSKFDHSEMFLLGEDALGERRVLVRRDGQSSINPF
ncbi:MAG TPA: hypothetical protein VKC60_11385 [Opitutaceae bacterium]|nr:hypothetical protein [Opitutaceae bacterium]